MRKITIELPESVYKRLEAIARSRTLGKAETTDEVAATLVAIAALDHCKIYANAMEDTK